VATTELANKIVAECLSDVSVSVAIIGLVGVVIGALLAILGNLLLHWVQDRPRRKLDKSRKTLLIKMLQDGRFQDKWRHISTLSRVVGADKETTERLLIEINARGSEKDDGLWGLIEFHPLEELNK
jgi:hypothetical protein